MPVCGFHRLELTLRLSDNGLRLGRFSAGRRVVFGYRWALLMVLEMFAVVSARQGHAERSLVQAGAAAAARDHSGTPIPPHGEALVREALERARGELGEAASTAWARGQAMTFERALRDAMDDGGARQHEPPVQSRSQPEPDPPAHTTQALWQRGMTKWGRRRGE